MIETIVDRLRSQFDLKSGTRRLHNALRSSGTSPNFGITVASPKSPVDGSALRLKATAPTMSGLPGIASRSTDIPATCRQHIARLRP